ncbi:MAG: hypothetical protein JXQ72_16540 [Anaerolineae bacterium]|nr:hypothetical protein [Anaerolineae bacterium]
MLDATLRILVKLFASRGVVMIFDADVITLAYPGRPPVQRVFQRSTPNLGPVLLRALQNVTTLDAIDQRGIRHDYHV